MSVKFVCRKTHIGLKYGESAHNYYWNKTNNEGATITSGLANCTTYARGRALEVGLPYPMNEHCDAAKWHTKLTNGWTYINFDKSKVEPGDILEWSNPNNHVAFVENIENDIIYVSSSWYTGIHGKSYYDGKYDKRTGIGSLQELSDFMFDNYLYRTFHYCTLEKENSGSSNGCYPTYILKYKKEGEKVSTFTRRYTKPTTKDKNFVLKADGGWNDCVVGKPTDSQCRCLSNCVGYASGRFNEIYNELTGKSGCNYPYLNCNAEDFIERVKKFYPDIIIDNNPEVGAIMCWRKGSTGTGKDGAGHVAIVEDILERDGNGTPISVRTSESSYGGTAFYNKVRSKGDGNWGLSGTYAFRAFIHNPEVTDNLPTPVERNKYVNQFEVLVSNLRVRSLPTLEGQTLGYAYKGFYDVLASSNADGYTWYKIAENCWCALVEDASIFHKKEEKWKEPEPVDQDKTVDQVYIPDICLRIREEPTTDSTQMGLCKQNVYYNVLDVVPEDDYTWYKIGDKSYIAGVDGVIFIKKEDETTVKELKKQVAELEKLNKELENKVNTLSAELTKLNDKVSKAKSSSENTTDILKS